MLLGGRVRGEAGKRNRRLSADPVHEVLQRSADHSRTWSDGSGGEGCRGEVRSLSASTSVMLADIESAKDHMEPEELADRLMKGETRPQAGRYSPSGRIRSLSYPRGCQHIHVRFACCPGRKRGRRDHHPLLQRHDASGSGAGRSFQDGLHERLHSHRRHCGIYRPHPETRFPPDGASICRADGKDQLLATVLFRPRNRTNGSSPTRRAFACFSTHRARVAGTG